MAAGANVVANVATLVNTAVMTSVTAVMGDYHQIDAITQAYIYSDRDEIASVFTRSEDQADTAAYNIANFERSVFPGGSRFGYALLTVALISNIMAIVLQSLCARLAIASGRDLAQACRDAYPKPARAHAQVAWRLSHV